jgi:hypothetical protein
MQLNFHWDGRPLPTWEAIFEAAFEIASNHPARAGEFMDEFVAEVHRAGLDIDPLSLFYENLGYMGGYYSHDERVKVYDVFNTKHPFFGRKDIKATEAFEIGKQWGEAMKRGERFP